MAEALRAVRAAARLELEQLGRSRVLVTLVVLEAITFLVLVSLFGLTGSRAPTALIDRDDGPLARSFVDHLDAAHHSFALRPMSADRASEQISSGDILAIITIPSDFSRRVEGAGTSVVPITVDNVNEDLTGDVREAMPSAVTTLGACIGALLRRTLPVSALFFGLALPFYVDSGALEPLRFDGEKLWVLGHASPVYSAIGVLQWGFHGLRVTPESVLQNVLVLCLWALASVLVAAAVLSRRVVRQ